MMEQKMLAELQKTVDFVKEAREMGCEDFVNSGMKTFDIEKTFVENITGKKVTIKKWQVVWEEN